MYSVRSPWFVSLPLSTGHKAYSPVTATWTGDVEAMCQRSLHNDQPEVIRSDGWEAG